MLINEKLKTLHFNYDNFSFFDSRWINKDQILSYPVLKLFFYWNNLLNLDYYVYILIPTLDLLIINM
jgi:hypothetical protein